MPGLPTLPGLPAGLALAGLPAIPGLPTLAGLTAPKGDGPMFSGQIVDYNEENRLVFEL